MRHEPPHETDRLDHGGREAMDEGRKRHEEAMEQGRKRHEEAMEQGGKRHDEDMTALRALIARTAPAGSNAEAD